MNYNSIFHVKPAFVKLVNPFASLVDISLHFIAFFLLLLKKNRNHTRNSEVSVFTLCKHKTYFIKKKKIYYS